MHKKQGVKQPSVGWALEALRRAQPPDVVDAFLFDTPFACLVSVLLSARTRGPQAIRFANELLQQAPDPQALLELGSERCSTILKPLGLQRSRAQQLMGIASAWSTLGPVESWSKTKLLALPGIGIKCAHLILTLVLKKPHMVVDTHVFRIARRVGWSDAHTSERVTHDLEPQLDPSDYLEFNQRLVVHGRQRCRPRRPQCHRCVLSSQCVWFQKSIQQ